MTTITDILNGQGETLIVQNHLQQMITFARAGGVEFLPQIDENNARKFFIDNLVRWSKLDTRIDAHLYRLIKSGRFLLFLRSTGNDRIPYKILDYKAENYRAFYDGSGEIDSVLLCYSYKERQNNQLRDRWVRLRITAQTIEKREMDQKPDLDREDANPNAGVIPNPLGFVPCVEVLNSPPASDKEGVGDFAEFGRHIERLDDLTAAINDNIEFFCASPLETTLDANELTETAPQLNRNNPAGSVTIASGFRGEDELPNRRTGRTAIKRLIGGLDPEVGDYIRQIPINPVPGDQIAHADGYERSLREAMGGILERGIETAAETNAVYGKVIANARRKQKALFTHGLCQIFEMALFAEEALYQVSQGAQGLPPLGDRTVNYRVAPVFVESTNEVNLRSITARNLMKFNGISAKESLKYVFPGKSDAELDTMVSNGGFPSDYLSTAIAMYGQLSQTLDPMTGFPVADPATGQSLASLLLPFITQNLQYGRNFDINPNPTDPVPNPVAALIAALESVRFRSERSEQLVPGDDRQPAGALDLPTESSTVNAPSGFFVTNFPTFTAFGNSIGSAFNRPKTR
jgi:hypothetical protein